MEPQVTISLKEYEQLKEDAANRKIKVSGTGRSDNGVLTSANIKIDMRELKLQICRQQGINPNVTTVNFY